MASTVGYGYAVLFIRAANSRKPIASTVRMNGTRWTVNPITTMQPSEISQMPSEKYLSPISWYA